MSVSEFRQWLTEHDPDTVVGLANHPQCPIADFVSDVIGEHVGFYGSHFELGTGEHADVKVEEWMGPFVLLLDSDEGPGYHHVTAARALRVLDGIVPWHADPGPSFPSMQELLGRAKERPPTRR